MRIRLIKEQTIQDYANAEGKKGLVFYKWMEVIKSANVANYNDLLSLFNSADTLGKKSHRVCFNVGGNNYRIICKVMFGQKKCHMFVCWIGTHVEYDELCKLNLQYEIEIY